MSRPTPFRGAEQIAVEQRLQASHRANVAAAERRLQGYDDLSAGRDLEKQLGEIKRELWQEIAHLRGQIEELARSVSQLEGKLQNAERDAAMEDNNSGGWL